VSTGPTGSQDRVRAARVLTDIVNRGKTIDQSFGRSDPSPLLQELVYGTLRHYQALNDLVSAELERALRSKDLDLRCLMLVGAYQLHYMRIPDHAAINETVNACRGLKKPWARGLVNAVLRKVAKSKPNERSYGLPAWMVQKLDKTYQAASRPLQAATQERAPMSLRVNLSRTSPDDYLALLEEGEVAAAPGWIPENLILEQPIPVRSLPGHKEGLVSVQDAGALFAADLVISKPAGRILDACAAPGGKLFHIVERAPDATVVGLEISGPRLAHLEAEAMRLGHDSVELIQGDATNLDWHDGSSFDAILLDAPCSGSGTLRRHPDIKFLRQESDLAAYARLQQSMLENLISLLSAGGTLVYCTCSLFPEENDAVIETFLEKHPEVQLAELALPTGRPTRFGWQLLPLPAEGGPNRTVDGFYFARMTLPG
jgi:16S rRNA (cytosine967-C5)-methyltransferase